jgi:hypothetical protein
MEPATSLESDAFPIDRSMLVGFVVAVVLALAVAGSVYLSMINHGHSFVRLFAWQSGTWGFWALVCPLVLRLSGPRLSRSDSLAYRLAVAVAVGLVLIALHDLVTAALTAWTRPFYPLQPGSVARNLVTQLPSLVAIDALVQSGGADVDALWRRHHSAAPRRVLAAGRDR